MRQTHISINNETPLYTWRKASYTLEAVVVFPLIAIFFMMLLFMFRVIQVERDVQFALYQGGRKMAVSSASMEGGITDFVLAQYYFQQEIKDSKYIENYVKGGKS